MTDNNLDVDNPYKHSQLAQQHELAQDFRKAESEFKAAIRAADALPLAEYKSHFKAIWRKNTWSNTPLKISIRTRT